MTNKKVECVADSQYSQITANAEAAVINDKWTENERNAIELSLRTLSSDSRLYKECSAESKKSCSNYNPLYSRSAKYS